MAGADCQVCVIGAMDRLWFHHIILFSEPPPPPPPPPPQQFSPPVEEISSEESDDDLEKERPARLINLKQVSVKGRMHHSSSPISSQKRRIRNLHIAPLKKSSSCKTLMDLELEEVKGFMELGFIFRRENLTKRTIHLVPGLQRISNGSDDEDEGEERKEVIRPYLSEAWVVKSPNDHSPLMNLRIPAVSTAADMKKHLMCWAHTVASSIHQQS